MGYREFVNPTTHQGSIVKKTTGEISVTGQSKASWTLDLRIVCKDSQIPDVQVLRYENLSDEEDLLETAVQQVKDTLQDGVTQNVTSTYVGFKEEKSGRYKIILAPRQEGKALAVWLPSSWDKSDAKHNREPKVLRLKYFVPDPKDKTKQKDENVIVWVFPKPETIGQFLTIAKSFDLDKQLKGRTSGSFDFSGKSDPVLALKSESRPDWARFFKELERTSCACFGRADTKFSYMELYTIPREYVHNLAAIALTELKGDFR